MPRASRLYTYKDNPAIFNSYDITQPCFLVSFYRFGLHKAFSLTPQKPSLQPLPGIPEPSLTFENVKNEEKAEEGEASAVTGRVLSHGANISQSPREAARRKDGIALNS